MPYLGSQYNSILNFIDGPKIPKLDPSHPSLLAFEAIYTWEGIQEEDYAVAIRVMFTSSIVILAGLTYSVWKNHDIHVISKVVDNSRIKR